MSRFAIVDASIYNADLADYLRSGLNVRQLVAVCLHFVV